MSPTDVACLGVMPGLQPQLLPPQTTPVTRRARMEFVSVGELVLEEERGIITPLAPLN